MIDNKWHYSVRDIQNIYFSSLGALDIEKDVVTVEGIYRPFSNQGQYANAYGKLESVEEAGSYINLQLPKSLALKLQPYSNTLVALRGTMVRRNRTGSVKSAVEYQLVCSGCDQVINDYLPEQAMSMTRLRQMAAQRAMSQPHVVSVLKNRLYKREKPRIAMIWPNTTQTQTEFRNALGQMGDYYDLHFFKASFASSDQLIEVIRKVDRTDFDVIALVRGGGSGLEKLDDPQLLETLVCCRLPVIVAVGHAEDVLSIKQLADYAADTPTAFGQMLEKVALRSLQDLDIEVSIDNSIEQTILPGSPTSALEKKENLLCGRNVLIFLTLVMIFVLLVAAFA